MPECLILTGQLVFRGSQDHRFQQLGLNIVVFADEMRPEADRDLVAGVSRYLAGRNTSSQSSRSGVVNTLP